MRFALASAIALGLLALAAGPAQAAADTSAIYDNGEYCQATIHTSCGHETANGVCYLYVGLHAESCIVYEG